MKDLIESLNRAHELDEQSVRMTHSKRPHERNESITRKRTPALKEEYHADSYRKDGTPDNLADKIAYFAQQFRYEGVLAFDYRCIRATFVVSGDVSLQLRLGMSELSPFSEEEIAEMDKKLDAFVAALEAEGYVLKGSPKVSERFFLVSNGWGNRGRYVTLRILNRAHKQDEEFNCSTELNEASNKWLRAIKSWIKDKEAANIVYQWYDNEDAFEDFDNVDDFIDYAKDDIYNMFDGASVKERKIVAQAIGYDVYEEDPEDDEGDDDTYAKEYPSSSSSQSTSSNVFKMDWDSRKDLEHVDIPEGVTEIGYRALSDCWSLTSVTIPDSVTEIGPEAFNACGALQNITIPDSVTIIGQSAFTSCRSLTSVTIPNSVTELGDSVFAYCANLQAVTLGNSFTEIGYCAFDKCRSLENVRIPDNVTRIGDYAFSDCSNLTRIVIPDSVSFIGRSVFNKCPNLVIFCSKDSYAHKYALENNIPVKLIESVNSEHKLDESKLKQNFICSDCRSKLTRNELDRAMWKGVPYFICPCCEHPITRISASELDPDEEIEYEIYS